METQNALHNRSLELFGVGCLDRPADESDYVPREDSTASQRLRLAPGLQADFVVRNVGFKDDVFFKFKILVCRGD